MDRNHENETDNQRWVRNQPGRKALDVKIHNLAYQLHGNATAESKDKAISFMRNIRDAHPHLAPFDSTPDKPTGDSK